SRQFSCLHDENRRGVDTKSLRDLRQAHKKARYCSGATADFKDACLFWEHYLGDKVLEYAPLQKVRGAKLQCRSQPIEHYRIGSGDPSIDVRHNTSSPWARPARYKFGQAEHRPNARQSVGRVLG